MYEFKFKEETYVALVKEYWKIYENDFYKVIVDYPYDENKKPLNVFEPEKNLHFSVIPKKKGVYPNISFTMKKADQDDCSYVRVFINFERSVAFRDMKNEEDEWLDAYNTVFELDKLVRKLCPGYKILNDEEIASRN